ncbi:ATP-binding protein [Tenacibaculum finnmarkense]|uniref:AAA family ATPase n=1 Tax=Tenacibaculum finnmarkense TaxID=2781243 RepID=UPI001EFB1D9D|nr:AAA family ATPase [Tenacibaculum finnmarkense]MCG8894664.1 ATP-binding protein [Tenacibaculum finnmarkense]
MKILKVEISKFRSIEKGEFKLTNLNAIVGQNNSGKSGIMRALNSFFNPNLELQFYNDGTNLFSTSYSVPRIIVTFSSVSENSIFEPYLINDVVKIKQEYNKKRKKLDYSIYDVNKKFKILSDEELKNLHKEIQFVLIPSERGLINNLETETGVLRNLFDKFFSANYSQRDTLTPKVKNAFEYFKDKALKKVSKGIESKYLAKRGFEITIDSM